MYSTDSSVITVHIFWREDKRSCFCLRRVAAKSMSVKFSSSSHSPGCDDWFFYRVDFLMN